MWALAWAALKGSTMVRWAAIIAVSTIGLKGYVMLKEQKAWWAGQEQVRVEVTKKANDDATRADEVRRQSERQTDAEQSKPAPVVAPGKPAPPRVRQPYERAG